MTESDGADSGRSLFLHFGGELLDPEEALLAWCRLLLQDGAKNRESLLAAFRDPDSVPYPFDVEPAELQPALDLGAQCGDLEIGDDGLVSLTSDCRTRILRHKEQAKVEEAQAQKEFDARIISVLPIATVTIRQELWTGLKDYAVKLMSAYVKGLDSPDSPDADAEALIDVVYPSGHALHDVAASEFPAFLRHTEAGKRILSRALTHVIYALRTSISEEAATQIQKGLKFKRLYLDTNVLFSVVGVRGEPDQEEGVRRVLRMAREMGFSLLYTPQTRDEYVHALRRFKKEFDPTGGQDQSPDYVLGRSRPSINKAFFLQRSRLERDVDEFYNHYSDLRARLAELEGLDITEVHVPDSEVEQVLSGQSYAETNDALLSIVQHLGYSRRQREHDAFNVALVDRERDRRDALSETPSWFLTLHGQLEELNRRLDREIPLVLTIDAWVMYFRPLFPRVDDFDRFFMAVVASNIFSGMELSDSDLENASRYLGGEIGRTAGDVIRRRFSATPTRQLREVVRSAGSSEALVQALDRLERERERRIAELISQQSASEADRLRELNRQQKEQMKRAREASLRAEQDKDARLADFDWLSRLDAQVEALDAGISACEDDIKRLSDMQANVLKERRTFQYLVIPAAVLIYVAAVLILRAWVPALEKGAQELLGALGLPVLPVAGISVITYRLAGRFRATSEKELLRDIETVESNKAELEEDRRDILGQVSRLREKLGIHPR